MLALIGAVVRWIYRRSDLLLVQSRGFLPRVRTMSGGIPVRYHPNPGELSDQQAEPAGPPALVLDRGFNVVFAGNLGSVQALDTVLRAAQLLRDLPEVRFVLIGSGSRGEWLNEERRRLGLTNVQMPGRFAAGQMPAILSQASVLLVSLVRSPIMSWTIPSKLQAYLAAGRPVIACLDGEGARVIEEAGAGISCAAEDAPALADAVRRLHGLSAAELSRMGALGRRYYEAHFHPTVLTGRLVEHFHDASQWRRGTHAKSLTGEDRR
jgi:glycosyltransferase involved in cell wall biosynthesis